MFAPANSDNLFFVKSPKMQYFSGFPFESYDQGFDKSIP